MKECKALVAVFLAALALRLLALIVFPTHGAIEDDAVDYDRIARNLLAGYGYSLSTAAPHEPTMARDPLYPFVLAALYALGGGSVHVALVIQALLSAFTPLLAYSLCQALNGFDLSTGRDKGALLAAWLTALYPVLVVSSSYLLVEWLATLLLTAALSLFVHAIYRDGIGRAAEAGIVFGLLALTRVTAQLLPIGLAVLLLAGGGLRRWLPRIGLPPLPAALRVVMPLLISFMLTVLPWSVRNRIAFGTFQLGGRSGQALWARTLNLPVMRYDKGPAVAIAQQERKHRQEQGLSYEEVDRQMGAEAMRAIRRYPLQYLAQNLREVRRMWITTYSSDFGLERTFGDYLAQRDYPAIAAKLLLIALNFATLGLCLWGTAVHWREWMHWWPLWATLLYFTGVYSFFWALPRYGILLYPTLLVFVGRGIEALITRRYPWSKPQA
jgi:hypothetical protein